MDGTKLAHDPRTLPKLQSLSATSEPDSKWRSRAVPVFASAMLAIVLGVVYFVSIRQTPTANAGSDSTTVEIPANEPTSPSPSPTVPEVTSVGTDAAPQTEADTKTREMETNKVTVPTEAKKPVDSRTEKQNVGRSSKPVQARNQRDVGAKQPPEKEDSKVRSIIKKTGRFFKKTLPL
jgi:hypothetical protein